MNSVNSGDKSGTKVMTGIQWCDHVDAKGHNLWNSPSIVKVRTPGVNLFAQGSEMYVMCDACLMKKLQVPLYRN